jgi:uncharacterized surface protein with fasciclin (FAS1) repeats
MIKRFRNLSLLIALLIVVLASCKKEMEKYYERPSSLAPPIYQQLEAMGRFSLYLKLVDRTAYKNVLDRTGYSTVFAPNDDAVRAFLSSNSYSSVDQIDEATANKIVAYSIVFNAYNENNLVNFQGGDGEKDSVAFKRKTMYDKGFYKLPSSDTSVYLDCNINYGSTYYLDNYNNYKYIPYFSSMFLEKENIPVSTYNYFFPTSEFTDFNVVDAKVITKDVVAENGYIHEVNKVILPLPNIEEYLESYSDYSLFKSLMDKYVIYTRSSTQTVRFANLYPSESGKSVYIKSYNLSFSPNNENYLNNYSGNDAQGDGFTIFAPNNQALTKFIEDRLAFYYDKNINNVPTDILKDIVNTHLFPTTAIPGYFSTASNFNQENARFDENADIEVKKFASNGIFYGTNKIQESDLFMSVWGDIRLNPDYSIMYAGLNAMSAELVKTTLMDRNQTLTVFLLPDALLRAHGYDYRSSESSPWYIPKATGGQSSASRIQDEFKAMLKMYIARYQSITDMSGDNIVATYGGDIIRYKNNAIMAAGNEDTSTLVTCASLTSGFVPSNGVCYIVNDTGMLRQSTNKIGYHIKKYFGTSLFYGYLLKSPVYSTSGTITGLKDGVFYTVLIPTDAAMNQAVTDGVIPALPGGTTAFTAEQAQLVKRFILYHIIDSKCVIADGTRENNDGFITTLKIDLDVTTIRTTSATGSLTFTDMYDRTANWVPANSNYLAKKAVIHQIDNYLRYRIF